MFDTKRPVVPLIATLKNQKVEVGRLFRPMPNHMRLTIGKKAEMEQFLTAFQQVTAEAPPRDSLEPRTRFSFDQLLERAFQRGPDIGGKHSLSARIRMNQVWKIAFLFITCLRWRGILKVTSRVACQRRQT